MLRQRNIALCVILSLVTCGIYALYWYVVLVDDVNTAAMENDNSGIFVMLLSLVTCGIYGLYWMYRMGYKIDRARQQRGASPSPNLPILYLVLSFLGLGIISYALIQDELNHMATA